MNDFFKVIQWPDIQSYMEMKDFWENAYLINDINGLEEYGSSAYFVRCSWLQNLEHE